MKPDRARWAILLVPLAVTGLLQPLIGPIAEATRLWGFGARASVAASCVFVAGVALGLPFALGMALFDEHDRAVAFLAFPRVRA